MNTNVKYALGAGIVTMVLLFAVMAAFAPMSDVAVAAPAAAPTPVANYPATDYTFAVFQPATAITADTNTNWVPVDLARFVDQNAQRLAGTVEAVCQQSRKSSVQRMMFYALCHGVDSFVGLGKNAPKKSPAETACRGRAAMLCRPPLFGRYAPSSLRPTKHRKTSRIQIYRRDVALTPRF